MQLSSEKKQKGFDRLDSAKRTCRAVLQIHPLLCSAYPLPRFSKAIVARPPEKSKSKRRVRKVMVNVSAPVKLAVDPPHLDEIKVIAAYEAHKTLELRRVAPGDPKCAHCPHCRNKVLLSNTDAKSKWLEAQRESRRIRAALLQESDSIDRFAQYKVRSRVADYERD